MSANDRQVAGNHYRVGGKGEQHWDRVARLRLDYFQAQITKYIERAPHKNGKQDIEKAKHFCEKYLEVYDRLYPPTQDTGAEPGPGYVDQDRRGQMSKTIMLDRHLFSASIGNPRKCVRCGQSPETHP